MIVHLIISILLLSLPIAFILSLLYIAVDGFYFFIRRYLFNDQVIVCRISDGEWFRTILKTNPFGELYAYRYPNDKIGYVKINDNGTGYFYGNIEWKKEI